jgi:hypothetical protein
MRICRQVQQSLYQTERGGDKAADTHSGVSRCLIRAVVERSLRSLQDLVRFNHTRHETRSSREMQLEQRNYQHHLERSRRLRAAHAFTGYLRAGNVEERAGIMTGEVRQDPESVFAVCTAAIVFLGDL